MSQNVLSVVTPLWACTVPFGVHHHSQNIRLLRYPLAYDHLESLRILRHHTLVGMANDEASVATANLSSPESPCKDCCGRTQILLRGDGASLMAEADSIPFEASWLAKSTILDVKAFVCCCRQILN